MLMERFKESPVGVLVPISSCDPRFGEEYEHRAFASHPLPEEIDLSSQTWVLACEAKLSIG